MFLVLWGFDVKPGREKEFESVYGPEGDWARLFRRDPAYQRTLLMRDPFRDCRYLTCDFWETREAHDAFKRVNSKEYSALDTVCEALTLAERKIGEFDRLIE